MFCVLLGVILCVTDAEGLRDLQTASSSLTKILIVRSSSSLTQTECTSIVPHFWLLKSHKVPWKTHPVAFRHIRKHAYLLSGGEINVKIKTTLLMFAH